ncbi:MAG: LLM class F420-dependent oxidoreductase [Alphaproteobacteria bacterium]
MKLGVTMFPTDYTISPTELAMAAEERGFESLWFPEHSHIPLSRESPWPGGDKLPKPYYDCMDPLVALAAAASVTKTLKLCTGICLIIQRDHLQLAKEIATLDQISDGRVVMGVGGGWNAEEMADHGTDFKTRFTVMRERIAALKVIWTQDTAEYHGEFVDFGPMTTRPKPVQKPHPPIIVGGGFPHGARRAIEYGDGWMPIGGRDVDIVELLSRFRQLVTEAGRGSDALGVSIFGLDGRTITDDEVARYRDAGIERLIIMLRSEDRDKVLPVLDRMAGLMPAAAA